MLVHSGELIQRDWTLWCRRFVAGYLSQADVQQVGLTGRFVRIAAVGLPRLELAREN